MSEIDITIWDTGEPSEFASECFQRADQNARACHWDAAGNWLSAAQWIVALEGRMDDVEAELNDVERERDDLVAEVGRLRERVYGLEQIADGRERTGISYDLDPS